MEKVSTVFSGRNDAQQEHECDGKWRNRWLSIALQREIVPVAENRTGLGPT